MLKAKLLGATAGAEAALAIEDVFSTYLYTGNGSTQTITNGIDLAGEGGLVWQKSRVQADDHRLSDTERGVNKTIRTNQTGAEFNVAGSNSVSQFNSDGFVSGLSDPFFNGEPIASWTFRKAPRFFDVVTYTGNGVTSRQIAHNLGIEPGMVVVKCTSQTSEWPVFHRSNSDYVYLNRTDANAVGSGRYIWGDGTSVIPPTDAVFTVYGGAESGNLVNANGQTYVAYLFAHDPLGPSGDGSDGLIACGSMTTGNDTINLGWEPQWLLVKRTDATGSWWMTDTMRGLVTGGDDQYLLANTSGAEGPVNLAEVTATGFKGYFGTAPQIYIAIRRGPMREPTVGTQVFEPDLSPNSNNPRFISGFPVDMALLRSRISDGVAGMDVTSRLTHLNFMRTGSTNAEGSQSSLRMDYMNGFDNDGDTSPNFVAHMFRRAPGFFDVVAYTGTGANPRSVTHNLKAPPELLILKSRQNARTWRVSVPAVTGTTQALILNSTTGAFSSTEFPALPTETTFTIDSDVNINANGENYIAYLFASLPGISKVGSLSHTYGSDTSVDCGFTSGARFVLIKRTDGARGWHVFDTARGIVAGNDPLLELNGTEAEAANLDLIDPLSSGFVFTGNNPTGSYIFLAIA